MNYRSDIKTNSNQCQEKKSIIQKKNNFYVSYRESEKKFIQDCNLFVKEIIRLDNNPWISSDLISWINKRDPRNRLSPIQENIIQFLQKRYFSKGDPCFTRQSYMASELGVHRPQISKALSDLVKKDIIIKVNWIFKGRRTNCMILPLIPSIAYMFKKENLVREKVEFRNEFQRCYSTCNDLFCNYTDLLKKQRSFYKYTNILHINNLLISNSITVEYIRLNYLSSLQNVPIPAHANKRTLNINIKKERKESKMYKRFGLKSKTALKESPTFLDFAEKLSVIDYNFDNLDIQTQNNLIGFMDYNFPLEVSFRSLFGYSQNSTRVPKAAIDNIKTIRQMYLMLTFKGFSIQWNYIQTLALKWNSLCPKTTSLRTIKINEKSKTYLYAAIALSYRLFFDCGAIRNRIDNAFDRLENNIKLKRRVYPLTSYIPGKVGFDTFFSNFSNNAYLDAYLKNDLEYDRWRFKRKVKHPEALPAFKEVYINTFYNRHPEVGENKFYRYESIVSNFLDNKIADIKKHKCNTCELSLIRELDGNPPILQFYMHFLFDLKYDRKSKLDLFDICNYHDDKLWNDFIYYMRNTEGYWDFWKSSFEKKNNFGEA